MKKNVKYLIPAQDVNMGGIILKQALPTQQVDQVDPFILLHHARFTFNANAKALQQGIGPHPHRGFSPVTFIVEGAIHHRDSRGHSQIATTGDVQWMHAGAGIVHSERPSEKLVQEGGAQEIIQIWINSPAASKMKQPLYQYLSGKDMPIFTAKDGLSMNKVVAGKINDKVGKIETESDMLILWSKSKASGVQTLEVDPSFNTAIYIIKGELNIGGYGKVGRKSLVVFDGEGSDIDLEILADAEYLTLSGKTIDEQIERHGPFVMNSQTEIMEAMRDYQMGKMGVLIEED